MRARADAGKKVSFVGMYGALTLADLYDGVHPNADGYFKMAQVWRAAHSSQFFPGSLYRHTQLPVQRMVGWAGACRIAGQLYLSDRSRGCAFGSRSTATSLAFASTKAH